MKRSTVQLLGLILVPGIMLFLSIPPFGLFPLSYVSLWPVFWVLRASTYSQKQKLGFAFLHMWIIGVLIHFWIYFACVGYGGLPAWMGVLALALFGCFANLEFGLAMAIALWVKKPAWRLPVYFGVFAGFQQLPFKFFPWSIAAPQVQVPWLASGYLFLGTMGMLVVSLFMNYMFTQAWSYWRQRKVQALYRWCGVMSGGVVLFLIFFGAKQSLESPMTVAKFLMVQGNIANAVKLQAERGMLTAIQNTVLTYQHLTDKALSAMSPPEREGLIVLWPETAYPISFNQELDPMSREVDAWQVRWMSTYPGVQYIFGAYGYAHYREHGTQNQMVWFRDKEHVSRYTKRTLLAFGEFLPFRSWLPPWIEELWPYEDFSPGRSRRAWPLSDQVRALPNICYEVLFDAVSMDRFSQEANLLLNVTNDGWWANRVAREVHFLMARERAATTGVPVVRVTNTGISAWVDGWGQVRERLPENQAVTQVMTVAVPLKPWGPVRWGWVQAGLGWLLLGLLMGWVLQSETRLLKQKHG